MVVFLFNVFLRVFSSAFIFLTSCLAPTSLPTYPYPIHYPSPWSVLLFVVPPIYPWRFTHPLTSPPHSWLVWGCRAVRRWAGGLAGAQGAGGPGAGAARPACGPSAGSATSVKTWKSLAGPVAWSSPASWDSAQRWVQHSYTCMNVYEERLIFSGMLWASTMLVCTAFDGLLPCFCTYYFNVLYFMLLKHFRTLVYK